MGRKFVLLGDMGLDHEGYPPTPVIAGSSTVLMDGKPIARIGDPLAIHAKPHHPPHPRFVAAGEPTILIEGKAVALTGHPVDCGGTLIGSGSGEVNGMGGGAMISSASANSSAGAGAGGLVQATGRNASATAVAGNSQTTAGAASENTSKSSDGTSDNTASTPGHAKAQSSEESVSPVFKTEKSPDQKAAANETKSDDAEEKTSKEPQKLSPEPGFHIVRKPMSKTELLQNLYGDASAKPDHFDRLNPNIGSRVLPSEMIVVGDPEGVECTQEEADLMRVASQVNQQLHTLDESEAQFLADHYDLLEMLTSNASTGMGVGAVMISNQMKSIKGTLRDLESLHQESYKKYRHLNSEEFFTKRRVLFKKLDFAMGNMVRKGMSVPDSPKLKSALGLSSKSIVHSWKQSGVGNIPGYATHYNSLAKLTGYIKGGGYAANFLNAGASGLKIYDVCTQGSDKECTKVKYTEGGRFGGSFSGGIVGAEAGSLLCGLAAVTTGGIGGVACVIILGGAGSAVGGSIGGDWGERRGEELYRYVEDE